MDTDNLKDYKAWADAKPIHPPNFGWLEYKLDSDTMDRLWKMISEKGADAKKTLAGNIKASYSLEDKENWFFNTTLLPLARRYREQFKNLGDRAPINQRHPYFQSHMWVNFQRENEFNPVHDHTGVYSYVIWMKIPTNHFEQNKNPISMYANTHRISSFDFVYTNTLGEVVSYQFEMGPYYEGTMLFFPSSLKHQVYTFYNCDEDRISVSGNILISTARRL